MLETKQTVDDASWFSYGRFGIFIHWGLYALPARHEWVRKYEEMTDEEYHKYFKHFYPDLYKPKDWARIAKEAAEGAYIIGEGLLGGKYKGIVDSLKLREASGTMFDHILLKGIELKKP